MIDRSLLRPFTRHAAETLTRACRLVVGGCQYLDVGGRLSINGTCNVRIANIILESIVPLAHERCVLTGLHNIVRMDPLIALEFLLHPSNLMKGLFRYASRIDASSFVGSVSREVSDYGKLCHVLGSSICLSLTDIKAMCLAEGISDNNCNTVAYLMHDWLWNVLHRSRPGIQRRAVNVMNVDVELEVVLAFFFMLRSARYIYDEIVDIEEVKKIGNIVHNLWKLLVSRSTEYGGPIFCLFKIASAMLIIKGELIASAVIEGKYGTDYKEIVLDNVLVCFKFTCNACNHGPGDTPCGKQVIVGSCSNDAICNAINSMVTHSSSPMKALSSLLSYVQSTEWLNKFIWFDSPIVNIVENIRLDLMLPFEMIERCCAPRLTSLAVESMPHISSDDMPSLMAIIENGFGACCAQRYEGMVDSKICIKDSFMTAMKCYELFFEAQMKSTRRVKWNRWLECVVVESPHRGLSKHDVCCFVVFIVDLCIFPIHMKCMMDASCKVRKTVNSLWRSGMSDVCASCIANDVVSLCEGVLFLGNAESKVLNSWIKDNIYVGSNSVKRLSNPFSTGFEDCYRNGSFLLPHEM